MNVDMYTRISLYLYKEKNLGWVLKHEHDFFLKKQWGSIKICQEVDVKLEKFRIQEIIYWKEAHRFGSI